MHMKSSKVCKQGNLQPPSREVRKLEKHNSEIQMQGTI